MRSPGGGGERPASFYQLGGEVPRLNYARAALEAGTLYVAEEDGEVYGCVSLNGEQLAEYAALNWSVPADPEDVMVIPPSASAPGGLGEGRHRSLWPSARRRPAGEGEKR